MLLNTIEALKFRYACRTMNSKKKIPEGDLNKILEAGRLSPSSLGLEHWHFVVEKGNKEKLKNMCMNQKQVGDSSLTIIILHKKDDLLNPSSKDLEGKIQRIPVDEEVKGWIYSGYKEFYNKINVDYWSKAQCYLAAGNMMTMGAALGIDSSPMEGFSEKDILDHYNIEPSKFGVALVVAFGYRNEEQPIRIRSNLNDLVTIYEEE